jgi:benzodiazapine receptor
MVAALLLLLVMVGVGVVFNPSQKQFEWFIRLRRPAWLTFEGLIPLIWISIYACFYASALLAWNASWSWGLMAGYLGLLVLVQSYTLLICTTPRFQERCHPFDPSIRGLEDMTNAPIQRGR